MKVISNQYHIIIKLFIVFFVAFGVAYWRFGAWQPKNFALDDLSSLWAFYDGQFASTVHQALFGMFVEKYRPVFSLICYVVFSTFEKNVWLYMLLNMVIQAINGLLFFIIALNLSKNKFFVPFALTIAFVSSRFALYQVTQITGLVESTALLFFFVMLYAVLKSLDEGASKKWQWLAILAITFAIYTHERYIVVLPWLSFVFLVFPTNKDVTLRYRLLLAIICLAILISNFLIKIGLLQITFFTGTGGSHISIDMSMITRHISEAFFSLLGFNKGPIYLIGKRISIKYLFPFLMAAVFFLSFLYVNVRSMIISTNSWKSTLSYLLVGLSLICLLLIPPVLTIRLEARWEYTPFALVLLSFAWSYGLPKKHSEKLLGALCVIASLAIIQVDTAISKYFDRIYMFEHARFIDTVHKDLLPPFVNQGSNQLLLLANKDVCDRVTASRFIELHTGRKPVIHCAQTKQDLMELKRRHPAVMFEYKKDIFVQI